MAAPSRCAGVALQCTSRMCLLSGVKASNSRPQGQHLWGGWRVGVVGVQGVHLCAGGV